MLDICNGMARTYGQVGYLAVSILLWLEKNQNMNDCLNAPALPGEEVFGGVVPGVDLAHVRDL